MKNNVKSLLLLQVAVMLFGFSGVIRRGIDASSISVATGRVIFSSIILFCLLKLLKIEISSKNKQDTLFTILAGILLSIHWTTFFQSIQLGSVAIGTITFSTFPMFLLWLEPMIYHEKISIVNIVLSIGLLIGVYITIPEFTLSNNITLGIVWGMICSITYAFLTLINRKLSKTYTGVWISFREQSVAAIILFPLFLYQHEILSTKDILGIASIGVICTAFAFSLFVSCQKNVSAQSAGISSGMETVYGILFACILLHEFPTSRELVGGIIILGITVLSIVYENNKQRR